MIKKYFIKTAAILAVSAFASTSNAANYTYAGTISSAEGPLSDLLGPSFGPIVGSDLSLNVEIDGNGDIQSARVIVEIGYAITACMASDVVGADSSFTCGGDAGAILEGGDENWAGTAGDVHDGIGNYTGPFQQHGSTVQDLGEELNGELMLRGAVMRATPIVLGLALDMYFTFVEGDVGALSVDLFTEGSAGETALTLTVDDLALSPVPVPAAAWLFGSALLGLAGVGRTRKAA